MKTVRLVYNYNLAVKRRYEIGLTGIGHKVKGNLNNESFNKTVSKKRGFPWTRRVERKGRGRKTQGGKQEKRRIL